MNLKNLLNCLFCVSLFFLSACDGDDNDSGVNLPSNLDFTATASVDGTGKVDVVAAADNASYYVIDFGDADSDPVQTTDGKASYTYKVSGTYTITVSAHASAADLIKKSKDVDVSVAFVDEGYQSPETRDGFSLVWEDDFEGNALSSNWTAEIGAGGWGNNESQYYRKENATVANGYLTITAKKESFSGSAYTSSRLITKGKKEFKYGRIDIRAKLPKGQGIWPALWMLGGNISTVGWPACGEIDIMEMIGGSNREKTVHGTVHWSNDGAHAQYGGSKTLSSGMYPDKFYVYSIEWNSTHIKWYIDDVLFHTIDITPSGLSEFHEPHFFIFNIAVGGNWPGYPDGTTVFPQTMVVDYVRVFQ
jgi:beta-glucanase (GH16 family)